MKCLPPLFVALAIAGAACDRSPQAAPAAVEIAQPEATAPAPEAATRADALLEDMRKRERDFAQSMRNAPPEPSPDELLRRMQQSAPAPTVTYAPTPTPVAAAPVTPAPPVVVASAGPSAPVRDEAWWKDRMRVLKARLDEAEHQAIAARAAMSSASLRLTQDEARSNYNSQIAAAASARAAIDDLELEARRAGIPSGWLRP